MRLALRAISYENESVGSSHQQIEAFAPDHPKDKALQLWWRHVRQHPWIYSLGLISIIAVDFADVGIPSVMKHFMDSLELRQEKNIYVLYLIALIALQYICRILWRVTWAQQTHVVAAAMKARLWERATYFPWKRLHEDLNPGEMMNIAAGDVNNARTIFGFALVTATDIFFLVLFGSIAMFKIHPTMAVLCLSIYLFVIPKLKKISDNQGKDFETAQEKLSLTSETLAQYLRNIRHEKLFSSAHFWQKKLSEDAANYRNARQKTLHWELAYVPVAGAAPLLAYIFFLSLGLKFYWNSQISLGSFVAFQSLLFILQDPLLEIGTCISDLRKATSSLKRYISTLQTEQDLIYKITESPKASATERRQNDCILSIKNLELPHGRNISLTLETGKKLGIRGPVGSGKSRLLSLIAGLDRNYQGSILFKGNEIRNSNHDKIRESIRIVPQKPFLFSTTLWDNLCLDKNIDPNELYKVLHICNLDEDFKNLDEALHKPLFEWGQNLSGGQKQRITLARSLIQPADLYLFDDTMSAVDQKTEEKILTRISKYYPNSSIVWTAHRSSTLKLCDQSIEWNLS